MISLETLQLSRFTINIPSISDLRNCYYLTSLWKLPEPSQNTLLPLTQLPGKCFLNATYAIQSRNLKNLIGKKIHPFQNSAIVIILQTLVKTVCAHSKYSPTVLNFQNLAYIWVCVTNTNKYIISENNLWYISYHIEILLYKYAKYIILLYYYTCHVADPLLVKVWEFLFICINLYCSNECITIY